MLFFNKIIVHPLPDGCNWITEDWTAVLLDENRLIFIPQKFKTDFGSIPKALWSIVGAPATGCHRRGVFFHDALYQSQQCSRKEADDICLEIMANDETGFIERYLIHLGVRVGGWVAWNRKTKESKENYIVMQRKQFAYNVLSDDHKIFA